MKLFIYLITFFLLSTPVAMANDLTHVETVVKDKIGVTIGFVRNKSMEKQTRNQNILNTLDPIFDYKRMAQLSLGKRWKKLNKTKKKEFSEVFIKKAQESFLDKLDLYPDVNVEFKKAKQIKKKIHVLTNFTNHDDNIDVLFKFYKSKKKGWVVYDFEILGVSLIQTYRSQFHGVLKDGNIDDLIKKLGSTGIISMSKPEKS